MEIRRGKKEEFYTIIDFIDFVFSKAHEPHDFLKLYANLYLETDESMRNMINMWDGGQIVGSILSLPRTMVVGGKALKVCGIGSVACHPRMGGKGIMSRLMTYNNEEMRKDGVHLACLGGRRSRYNHFGYEEGGTNFSAEVSASAMQARLPDYDGSRYAFVPFSMENREMLNACHALYNSKPIHYDYTPEEFFLRLTIPCCGAKPFAIQKDGEFCGYISYSDTSKLNIVEMTLCDDNDSADVMLTLAAQHKKTVTIDLYEYQLPYFRPIADVGSLLDMDGSGMWKVLDWKSVLEALLTFKASYMTLPEGTLVLTLGDTTYSVTLRDGKAAVTGTAQSADFSFGELEAVSALTSPVTQSYFGLCGDLTKMTLARSWFPLPLSRLFAERV